MQAVVIRKRRWAFLTAILLAGAIAVPLVAGWGSSPQEDAFRKGVTRIAAAVGYTDGTEIRPVRLDGAPAWIATLTRSVWRLNPRISWRNQTSTGVSPSSPRSFRPGHFGGPKTITSSTWRSAAWRRATSDFQLRAEPRMYMRGLSGSAANFIRLPVRG